MFGYLATIRTDVQKQLAIYYETFVDILEFHDQVRDLLTVFDACQITLDIVRKFRLMFFRNYAVTHLKSFVDNQF